MSKPARIGMIAYTFFASDPRVRRHVHNLLSVGYEVDLLVLPEPDGSEEPAREGLRVFTLGGRSYKSQGKGRIIFEYLRFAFACGRKLLDQQWRGAAYRMVHVNNMPNFLVIAALPLRLAGVPLLLDIHDVMPEIYRERFGVEAGHWMIRALGVEERFSMSLASFVISTEHTKLDRLVRNGLRPSKGEVTLNLPDSSLFPEPELPPAPASRAGTFRLVYHGTLARRLGVDVAIEAVARLKNRIDDFRLEVIGNGEHRDELVALSERLGVARLVRFSDGFVPVADIPRLIAGADLGIIPSRNVPATAYMLPTKLLEYVRMGIPSITVATPTIMHYFTESQVKLFPSEDAGALADLVEELYHDPGKRLAMARSAREFTERFNFESERDRYLEIVAGLIKSG